MFKKFTASLLSLILCLVWAAQTVAPALASVPSWTNNEVGGPSPLSPAAQEADPGNNLTFLQLGKADRVLRGPYDSYNFIFSVPASWKLSSGAQLELHMNASFTGQANAGDGGSPAFGGTLMVSFNNVSLAVLNINQLGEQIATLPIPDAALQSARKDGRHELDIRLDSGIDCKVDQNFNLVVSASSNFTLPHTQVAPVLDLTSFPSPFSLDSAWPDQAVIVVPDQPSAEELQSALTISAGLGNLVSKSLTLTLAKESQLTEEQKSTSHIVLVGKAASLSSLASYQLASPVAASGFAASQDDQDGVIQLLASPWNASKVVLVASGGSDAGVVKAAQAISTGLIRPSNQPNVAVVSNVSERQYPDVVPVDQTLDSLGYTKAMTQRVSYPGEASDLYEFIVPPGQEPVGDAYFQLVFGHSALLDFSRSGLVVLLNDQPIGSFQFTADSARQKNTVSFNIPSIDLQPGRNILEVRADLFPFDNCTRPQLDSLWFSVWRESSLHLPLQPISTGSTTLFDLDFYPAPFVLHATLGDTAFVVAKDDVVGWNAAVKIAARLGDQLNGKIITVKTFYADAIPEQARQSYHLLVVGKPSQIPLYSELQDALPSPVDLATNTPKQLGYVTYRLSDQSSVGYLEMLRSPWSANRVVLAVFGNSDQGLNRAVDALTLSDLRTQLSGDYVEVTDSQLIALDTRILSEQMVNTAGSGQSQDSQAGSQNVLTAGQADTSVGTPSPGIQAAVVAGAQPISLTPYPVERPAWVLPAMLGTLALILFILLFVIVNGIRQERQ